MSISSCKKNVFDTTQPNEIGDVACDTIDYLKHIKPIFDANCVSCHVSGGTAPNDYTKLDEIQRDKDKIKQRAVIQKDMPPGAPLSDEELYLLGKWIDCGAKDSVEQVVTYANDIAPIFASNCNGCHTNGGTAPGDFSNYSEIKNAIENKNLEGRVFVQEDMPPSGPLNDNSKALLRKWINQGFPNN